MKCIAHRGYSNMFRDNTIESIKGALERGYDGVEIDIQLCLTGELVLFHDLYDKDEFISEMTIDELRKRGIITLQDVYDQIPEIQESLLILDIKGNDLNIVHELVKFFINRNTDNIYFCSFNRKIIYNLPYYFKRGSTFETVFHETEYDRLTTGLSAVVVHWTCLDQTLISYCNQRNIRVYTYTHKDDKELEYMYKYNVDGIITNGF
jgi:glycerophosphoryl diester phosphodiesterase